MHAPVRPISGLGTPLDVLFLVEPSAPSTPNLGVSGSRSVPGTVACDGQARLRTRSGDYSKQPQRRMGTCGPGRSGCHPEGAPANAHPRCWRLSTYSRYAFEAPPSGLDVCGRADTKIRG